MTGLEKLRELAQTDIPPYKRTDLQRQLGDIAYQIEREFRDEIKKLTNQQDSWEMLREDMERNNPCIYYGAKSSLHCDDSGCRYYEEHGSARECRKAMYDDFIARAKDIAKREYG